MNKKSKAQMLGIPIVVIAMVAAANCAASDGRGQREANRDMRAQKQGAVSKVTDRLIRAVVPRGEWLCREETEKGIWETAFKLKLAAKRTKVMTPTGPILPIEGNPAVFNAAMTTSASDVYSRFGFWTVSAGAVTLKWYAVWNEDPTNSRAMARAFLGVNRYPGEVQIDRAIIDNLERGIDVGSVKSGKYTDDSIEIKVEKIEQTRFSGRVRNIRPPNPPATGIHAYEYEPNSGKIRPIRPPGRSGSGIRADAFRPIRCDRQPAAEGKR